MAKSIKIKKTLDKNKVSGIIYFVRFIFIK